MQNLHDGIEKFQDQVFGHKRELFEKLSEGQSPGTMFITCSDSRIVPNLLTQTGPGELFTLRNAGNIIPPYGASNGGESPTIEYAVSVLGVKDIVVCGHSNCGAIGALLHPEKVRHLPSVAAWLGHAEATRRVLEENYSHLSGDELLNAAIQENVLMQIENLETHPTVRARMARGKLALHAWVYRFETGQVYIYAAQARRFIAINTEAFAGESEVAETSDAAPKSAQE